MKKLELSPPGLVELSDQKKKTIEGGGIASGWWAVIWDALNHFGEIREGLSDGFGDNSLRY